MKVSFWGSHMGLPHSTKAINLECSTHRWSCFFAICRKVVSSMRGQHTVGKNWDAGWGGPCQHFRQQLGFLQRPSCLLAFPDLPWYSEPVDSIRYPTAPTSGGHFALAGSHWVSFVLCHSRLNSLSEVQAEWATSIFPTTRFTLLRPASSLAQS